MEDEMSLTQESGGEETDNPDSLNTVSDNNIKEKEIGREKDLSQGRIIFTENETVSEATEETSEISLSINSDAARNSEWESAVGVSSTDGQRRALGEQGENCQTLQINDKTNEENLKNHISSGLMSASDESMTIDDEMLDNETECRPIILNVRGNATDMDCECEASNTNDIVRSSVQNAVTEEGNMSVTNILLMAENGDVLVSESNKGSNSQDAVDQSTIASDVLKSIITKASICKPMDSSTLTKEPVGSIYVTPVPSLTHVRNTKTVTVSKSVSLLRPSHAAPISLLNGAKKSVPSSSTPVNISIVPTSLNSSNASAKHQNQISLFATKSNSSKVKIILAGVQDRVPVPAKAPLLSKNANQDTGKNSSTNDPNVNDSSGSGTVSSYPSFYYKSIIEKIFCNVVNLEALNRQEAFATKLLTPVKKPRENEKKEFVCSVCGDEFFIEDFLQKHFERKVFVLYYQCDPCKVKIKFYNKCKFWLHMWTEHPDRSSLEHLKNETSSFVLKPYCFFDESENSDFICKYCHKFFKSKELRKQHFSRFESVEAIDNCRTCNLTLLNSCALRAHQSIHLAKHYDVVCPECGEPCHQSDGLRSLFDHLDSCNHFNLGFTITCLCRTTFTSMNAIKHHFLNSHIKPVSRPNALRCSACKVLFSSYAELSLHSKLKHGISPLPLQFVLCEICDKVIFNFCKLRQHIENHVKDFNSTRNKVLLCYICKNYFNDSETLNNHVEKEHNHKPNRCTICFGLFESRQTLVQHIVSKTCIPGQLSQMLHVCLDAAPDKNKEEVIDLTSYKRAFKDFQAAENSVEPTVIVPPASLAKDNPTPIKAKMVEKPKSVQKRVALPITSEKFQCHSCKICLLGSHHYSKHVLLHKISGINRNSTCCGVCKKMVDDSMIKSHMEDHQKRGIIVCTHCHSRNFKSMQDALQHPKKFCFYKVVEDDGASYIVRKESLTANERIDSCDLMEEETDNHMQTQDEEVGEETSSVFPCLRCDLAFSSKQEKEDHVSRIHDGIRTVYLCLACKKRGVVKSFTQKHLIVKHISHKHRIVNPSTIASLIHQEEQNLNSGCVVPAELNGQGSGDAPPPKRLRLATEGDFICGKCSFSSENATLFADHIATHNPKKEPQCPECGLCFTVLAALKKHLFVVHKIKAMDEYLENKGMLVTIEEEQADCEEYIDMEYSPSNSGYTVTYDPPELDNRVSHKKTKLLGGNSFECNVCYRLFSCEAMLKSHMRNHGMAFIRSKRHEKIGD